MTATFSRPFSSTVFFRTAMFAVAIVGLWFATQSAEAAEGRGKRKISYQGKNDLFYNYTVGPNPSSNRARMYVSPQPIPPNVGHTYTTYQPLMPHEYLYQHTRSYYSHVPGAGWTRTKVRYQTSGLNFQDMWHRLNRKY